MIELLTTDLRPHDCLVVAFTGVGHALGGIPFEFHRTLAGVDCAALYIRDRGRQWYQYGPEEGGSPDRIAKKILEAKLLCGAKRLVMLGNSMGGFGALLFSCFVTTDAVLAFAPQTVILPEVADQMGDARWIEIKRLIPTFYFGDLAMLARPLAKVTLIFGDADPLDRAHADRLAQAWDCNLLLVENSGHDATSALRDRGQLAKLISDAIAG